MASGPITSRQIEGRKVKAVTDSSWALTSPQMVTAAMKTRKGLLLGRKAVTNLDGVLKSKATTLTTKVRIVNTSFHLSRMDMTAGQ